MKFNTGFLDDLFGEKTMLEIRQDDGTLRKVRVSRAWLKKMETDGKMRITEAKENSVHLHIIGPDGLEHGSLTVGKDIQEDQYRKLVDSETGALYALKVYENGVPSTNIISREMWEKARRALDSV